MARVMKALAVLFGLLTAAGIVLFFAGWAWVLSWAITFGTFFYHFAMRLLVGHLFNRIMGNRGDYRKRRYQLRPFEIRLYRFLQVKKWKGKLPTYDPALFDSKLHSWEEIAGAMCQAELVHETIAALSFLPLLAAIPFGSFWVFLLTSIAAALFDLCFVAIQRYNRSRVLRLLQKSIPYGRNTNAQMES